MAFRLNQGGELGVWAEADQPGKKEVFRFQKKKGSVFPVKKKLVKIMMFEWLAKSLSSLSISLEASLSASKLGGGSSKMMISTTTPSKSFKGKKSVEIFPEP